MLLCNDEVKTDYDLAAHFTVIFNFGVVLFGEPISEVFGDVPKMDYIDSICKDIKNAVDDVSDDPVYVILNLCRVYAYLKDGVILSKEKGGLWVLVNLSEKYHYLIHSVLNNYSKGTTFSNDEDLCIDFCKYMLSLIFDLRILA
jgi:streptomycin 3"-adenylyltransferase